MFILLSLCLFGVAFGQRGLCSERPVSLCLRPMFDNRLAQHLLGYTSLDTLYMVMAMDSITFKDWCRSADIVDACIQEAQPDCFDTTEHRLEGIRQVIQYICTQPDKFTDFDSHGPCLVSLSVREEIERCSRQFSVDQMAALDHYRIYLNGSNTIQGMLDAMCRAMNSLLDCLNEAPEHACGEDASDWLKEIYRMYLEPEAERKGCILAKATEEESEGLTGLQWSICAGTAVLIVAIVTAVVCFCKCRSNRDGASDTRSDNPTVVTSVSDQEQYHLGQYPFGDLPDLPCASGGVPNPPPDLLDGAVGPAFPLDDQACGYSQQNTLNDKKEGVPPPPYDEIYSSQIDSKPPPYKP